MKTLIHEMTTADRTMAIPIRLLVVLMTVLALAQAQTSQVMQPENAALPNSVRVVSGPGSVPTGLSMIPVSTAFVHSNADQLPVELGESLRYEVAGRVGSVVVPLMRLPIVGPSVLSGIIKIIAVGPFRPKATKGFSIAILKGTHADAAIAGGGAAFVLPAVVTRVSGAGVCPALLKLKSSEKDNARVIRTARVAITPGTKLNPDPRTEVLDIRQDLIPSQIAVRDSGEISITPTAALEPGEYALVLIHTSSKELLSSAWAFTVLN